MIRLTTTFLAAALMAAGATVAFAQDDAEQPKPARQSWSFSGLFGKYDQAQVQRGFQVYKEVCSNCHRLSIPFRTLEDPYGPGYSVDQVKALAASYQVVNDEPNDKGEIFKRPGTLADIFPPPDSFPNDQAAAAALGKAPPDMALLAKARKYERGFPWFIFDALPFDQYQEMGADYIYAILNGYTKPDDLQWNLYYPGHRIAMPQPIVDAAVAYTDGTPPKLDNYARDVAAFLSWASEPTLAQRKNMGLKVMIFLIVLSALLYFTKKRVWKALH
jgi:cytochrome c1